MRPPARTLAAPLPLLLLAAQLAPAPAVCDPELYRGSRVLAVTAKDADQLKLLLGLEEHHNADFLNHPRQGVEVRMLVSPDKLEPVTKELQQASLQYRVVVEDTQKVIDEEKKTLLATRNMLRSSFENGTVTFSSYMRYQEINDYLRNLAALYPDLVSVESIGRSVKGRDINVVRISTSGGKGARAILLDAGIHAREWIAPATALYVIKELAENSRNHNDMLADLDWYIIPLLNPDGYEHSHKRDRMWRKNRNAAYSGICVGTDLNRNFGFGWNPDIGGSRSPCSLSFSGPHAFSEPESINFRNYVLRMNADKRFKMYLTLHSFGSYILYPWGWTPALPEDAYELDVIAQDANRAIVASGGQDYTIGSSTNVLYPAAGGSDDWVKGQGGISKSYTIELPPGGTLGFDMPPYRILPTVRNVFRGIQAFASHAQRLP